MKKNIFNIIFISSLCLFVIHFTKGQKNADSTFAQFFEKRYSFRIWTVCRDFSFSLKSLENSSANKTKYIPASTNFVGVGVTRKNFALNFFAKMPGTQQTQIKHQLQNSQDFKLNMYKRHVEGNLWYRKYYGFYAANDANYISLFSTKNKYKFRSDISIENFGGELYYIFNYRKYSLNATYKQTEQQKINAGSFLIMVNLSKTNQFADSNIYSNNYTTPNFRAQNINQIRNKQGSLFAGYAHTFVLKKYIFISPILLLGSGISQTDQLNYKKINTSLNSNYSIFGRIACGYNGKNMISGLIFEHDACYTKLAETSLDTHVLSGFLFFAYRFDFKKKK